MKRLVLKISGEALSSEHHSIDPESISGLVKLIQEVQNMGIELILVLGGGNIYRGSNLIASGVDPADSHNMSMLSTVFNALTLKNFLEKQGIKTVVMDALQVEFLEQYRAINARKYVDAGTIVIASSGGGTPFFTTDTTGVLRALELHADGMIKLTKVDGVYSSDPVKDPDAKKIDMISYDDFISANLQVLDQTAVIMARDNKLPIYVTKLDDLESLKKIINGGSAGTKISGN